ncbi:MAG: c-type cytochrome [Elusimicrobia bacterium]|nr:c-type cytochrome [Elusimicrobiota bacterium]
MRPAALLALVALAAPASAAGRRKAAVPFEAPPFSRIPDGAAGDEIRLGMRLVVETRSLLPEHAPGRLSCTNCHIAAGRTPGAMPFVGLSRAYPAYRERAGRVVTLAERVNECFERALNGKPLAPGSPEMRAILAYIGWLSADVPKGAEVAGRGLAPAPAPAAPDAERGRKVYALRCERCHGRDGSGQDDGDGGALYPALWGPLSFNLGASMARTSTAAAFVRRNMPKNSEGALSAQEAADVAEFFTRRPRPDFPGRAADWPKGGRPADAR